MGKKPAVKAKAKSKAEAAPEPVEEAPTAEQLEAKRLWQQRREATKWAQAQLEAVRGQLQAAQKRGKCDWLQASHEFHEIKMIKLVKRLEEKTLDAIPQEFRDGLQAYLAQCAGGPDIEQENLKEMKEIWEPFETEASAYKRNPETAESEEAIEKLKVWEPVTENGMKDFVALMASHASSGGVQEAGLVRLGGLFNEVARSGAEAPGLACASVMPAIEAGMKGHLADSAVQRAGCMALRGLSMAPGQLPLLRDAGGIELAVAALNEHYKIKEVASAANSCFWAMAKAADKGGPELATMRGAGVIESLMKVMFHWAWDQTLCGQIRVTLPFVHGE